MLSDFGWKLVELGQLPRHRPLSQSNWARISRNAAIGLLKLEKTRRYAIVSCYMYGFVHNSFDEIVNAMRVLSISAI